MNAGDEEAAHERTIEVVRSPTAPCRTPEARKRYDFRTGNPFLTGGADPGGCG